MHRVFVIALVASLAGCTAKVSATPRSAHDNPRPTHTHDFRDAKQRLNAHVYESADARFEVYCGCPYAEDRSIDPDACGFTPLPHESERAHRMEWDHVVPFARFARSHACYTEPRNRGESHREHCVAADPEVRAMEGDMHNLFPSLGQLNALREDYDLDEIEGESRLGGCDFEIDARTRRVEPREIARGELARAYLYMHVTYRMPLTDAERARFMRWHRADPPSDWERTRNERIARLQGNENPFVVNTGLSL